jgi:hypothetical protein
MFLVVGGSVVARVSTLIRPEWRAQKNARARVRRRSRGGAIEAKS